MRKRRFGLRVILRSLQETQVPEIKLFVWNEDGVTHCATEEDLDNILVTLIDGPKSGEVTLREVMHWTPYKDGRWYTVALKDNVYRKDNLKAEQSLYVTDPDTGMVTYQQSRQRDAFAAQVIEGWDFQNPTDESKILPVSEKGIGMLPDKVGFYLVNLIWVRYKGDPKSFRGISG